MKRLLACCLICVCLGCGETPQEVVVDSRVEETPHPAISSTVNRMIGHETFFIRRNSTISAMGLIHDCNNCHGKSPLRRIKKFRAANGQWHKITFELEEKDE